MIDASVPPVTPVPSECRAAEPAPLLVTQDFKVRAFSGQCEDYMPGIVDAYRQLASRHDVMVVAGSGSMYSGRYCNVDGIRVVKELGLKAIIIDRLHKEIVATLQEPVIAQRMAGAGLEPVGDTPAEFAQYLKSEAAKWGKLVKSAGIKPE